MENVRKLDKLINAEMDKLKNNRNIIQTSCWLSGLLCLLCLLLLIIFLIQRYSHSKMFLSTCNASAFKDLAGYRVYCVYCVWCCSSSFLFNATHLQLILEKNDEVSELNDNRHLQRNSKLELKCVETYSSALVEGVRRKKWKPNGKHKERHMKSLRLNSPHLTISLIKKKISCLSEFLNA